MTYIIGARSPFLPEDCAELLSDAPTVIRKRCPGLIEAARAKGWHPPRSIERVYDCSSAVRDLGYSPRYGIEHCLAADWDPSPAK